MEKNNDIKIRPRNAKPKGKLRFQAWLLVVAGILMIPVGIGLILLALGLWTLFVQPKRVARKFPFSYGLDNDRLYCFIEDGEEGWSIPWKDISSLGTKRIPKHGPKNVTIGLSDYTTFYETLERCQKKRHGPNSLYAKIMSNKYALGFSRLSYKGGILLPYQMLDRPAEEFVELLDTGYQLKPGKHLRIRVSVAVV